MAISYVNDLRLSEMATGDNSGTWGTVTNTNLELIGDALGYGTRAIANDSADNITIADGTADADRAMYLKLTGGGQACEVTLLPTTVSKVWMMENGTNSALTFKQGSSSASDKVIIPAGDTKIIATDGGGGSGVVYDVFASLSIGALTQDGGAVFNEASADVDFRVESNGNINMFKVDGGDNKIYIGHAADQAYDAGFTPALQIAQVGNTVYGGVGASHYSNDAEGPVLVFGSSRATSVTGTTIVADGDTLGRIEFQGMDGADFETGAAIWGQVDGTPGANDMPGRLVFYTTADGANSATERMRITSAGLVGIGTNAPAEMLEIFNAASPAIQLNDGGDFKSIFRLAGNDLEIVCWWKQ